MGILENFLIEYSGFFIYVGVGFIGGLCLYLLTLYANRRQKQQEKERQINIFLAEKLLVTMECLDKALNNNPEELPNTREVLNYHKREVENFIPPKEVEIRGD